MRYGVVICSAVLILMSCRGECERAEKILSQIEVVVDRLAEAERTASEAVTDQCTVTPGPGCDAAVAFLEKVRYRLEQAESLLRAATLAHSVACKTGEATERSVSEEEEGYAKDLRALKVLVDEEERQTDELLLE